MFHRWMDLLVMQDVALNIYALPTQAQARLLVYTECPINDHHDLILVSR